jgi:hypothetical protein
MTAKQVKTLRHITGSQLAINFHSTDLPLDRVEKYPQPRNQRKSKNILWKDKIDLKRNSKPVTHLTVYSATTKQYLKFTSKI